GVLRERVGAAEGGDGDAAGKANALALRVDRDRILRKLPADHLRDAAEHPVLVLASRGELRGRTVRQRIGEADAREGDGDALHHIGYRSGFGALALHEL